MLHEIGHNWRGAAFQSGGVSYWNQFVGLGGWTATDPKSSNSTWSTNEGRGDRWYLTTATFASGYARTNENEDFVESFAAYFTQRAGWTFDAGQVGAAAIPAKVGVISPWLSHL